MASKLLAVLLLVFFTGSLASPVVTNKTEVIPVNGATYVCERPLGALSSWYWDNEPSIPPRGCALPYSGAPGFIMLNAYRPGGRENVHWIYTEKKNDTRCLENWTYYAPDGKKVYATVKGRITKARDTKSWCGLPVFRLGGIVDKQFAICKCTLKPSSS